MALSACIARVQACSPARPPPELLRALAALTATRNELRPKGPRSRYRTRRRVQNRERWSALRCFLIDTYGEAALSGGIIDVAGGQGTLAFELCNVNRLPAVVVDPRPLNLKRVERKWRESAKMATGGFPEAHVATGGVPVAQSEAAEAARRAFSRRAHQEWHAAAAGTSDAPRRPLHWPVCWEEELWRPVVEASAGATLGEQQDDDDGDDSGRAGALERLEVSLRRLDEQARQLQWGAKGLVQEDAEEDAEEEEGDDDDDDDEGALGAAGVQQQQQQPGRPSAEAVWRQLRGCACIVGMHPDEAAEGIVDYALAAGKLFAVVPCCVYANKFPTRRDARSGRRVTDYDGLVAYLAHKAPGRIGVSTLPFEGKNKVVYLLPHAAGPGAARQDDDRAGGGMCEECEI